MRKIQSGQRAEPPLGAEEAGHSIAREGATTTTAAHATVIRAPRQHSLAGKLLAFNLLLQPLLVSKHLPCIRRLVATRVQLRQSCRHTAFDRVLLLLDVRPLTEQAVLGQYPTFTNKFNSWRARRGTAVLPGLHTTPAAAVRMEMHAGLHLLRCTVS